MTKIKSLLVISAILFSGSVFSQNMKLADATFAKEMCKKWNSSTLPKKLAAESAGGNDWIDTNVASGVSKGFQKIVSGRYGCKGWPKFEMVIEKQADGTAKCTSAGAYNGKKLTWQFLPSTEGWFDYAGSFGMGAFMVLAKNGFKGSYWTGKKNQGNFAIFFRFGGKLALKSDYKTGCTGLNVADADKAAANLRKKFGK